MRSLMAVMIVLAVGCGAGMPVEPEPSSSPNHLSTPYHTTCSGSITSSDGVRHMLAYSVYVQMDGSTTATCSVNSGQAATVGINTYRPDKEETTLFECYVHYDVSEPTFGSFTMLLVGGQGYAVYSDYGSPEDGAVISLACTSR